MEETQHETLPDESREMLREAMTKIQDATFDVLIKKPTRESEFFVHVQDDSGRPKAVRMRYRAIPPKEFDDMVAAHPPSAKAAREGAQWNKDTFPPALISAVSVTPRLSAEQAAELLESPNWSAGESQALFLNALTVCNSGLDVPFSAGD